MAVRAHIIYSLKMFYSFLLNQVIPLCVLSLLTVISHSRQPLFLKKTGKFQNTL